MTDTPDKKKPKTGLARRLPPWQIEGKREVKLDRILIMAALMAILVIYLLLRWINVVIPNLR
jgi:hypothetical protein